MPMMPRDADAARRAVLRYAHMLAGWDRPRRTAECPHCHGTGLAPSTDGKTECGFCY